MVYIYNINNNWLLIFFYFSIQTKNYESKKISCGCEGNLQYHYIIHVDIFYKIFLFIYERDRPIFGGILICRNCYLQFIGRYFYWNILVAFDRV